MRIAWSMGRLCWYVQRGIIYQLFQPAHIRLAMGVSNNILKKDKIEKGTVMHLGYNRLEFTRIAPEELPESHSESAPWRRVSVSLSV